jgi:hypothetical protein
MSALTGEGMPGFYAAVEQKIKVKLHIFFIVQSKDTSSLII